MPDSYSAQWESPSKTGGEWRTVASHVPFADAERELKRLVADRLHCRVVVHREGQEDYTLDERGGFNGPVKPSDR